ncbi:MAG: hypothetical protein AW07_04510 [Candidatus Accumulibacter sp. SK-11]|nr:MAG: hypothetical protein AW07_04510 [Candidatus Accumulibacter sp. SK-11]
MDHRDGVGQTQGAGRPGRRDLADAVPSDDLRRDAVPLQESRDAHLQCKECRLSDLGPAVAIVSVRPGQFVDQRKVAMAPEQRVDLAHGLKEERLLRQQPPAHSRPLAAISGVDERRPTGGSHCRAARHCCRLVPVCGEVEQCAADLG